jgi:hypothetical protein
VYYYLQPQLTGHHRSGPAPAPEEVRIRKPAFTRIAKTRHVSPHHFDFIRTRLGNKSEALALPAMSYEQGVAVLAFLGLAPRWDPLRGYPRFQQLLHGLSLDK